MSMLNRDGIIEIKDLSFTYNGSNKPALHSIQLSVGKGEFIGITGSTGAGKTTLSYCINGIIPYFLEGTYCGDVSIKGQSVFDLSGQEISRWVGSVFQDPESQLVSASVEEELAFGPENQAVAPEEILVRIEFALKSVGIEHLRHATIESLSGGQKQRVAIAAVLAMRPEIIVLDEPTAELDPVGTDEVFAVLEKLNAEFGVTIIIIEHKMEHLARFCNRLLIMENGQIVMNDEPVKIFKEWRKIQSLGLKPPQVTEFFGKLGLFHENEGELPVTLDKAHEQLEVLLKGEDDE